jgi:polysaccharide chain length determinant protein (PEP-CTERM system associated)
MAADPSQTLKALPSGPAGLLQQGRSQLDELATLAYSIAHGMWRYRWLSLSIAWAICLVGWTAVYAMPDVYRATTRIYIDAESMIKRVVGDFTLSGNVLAEINVLTRVMLSQPQLEKTARLAGLDVFAQTPEQQEALIENLRQRIVLSREGGENIFRITFTDSDRQTAETVVRTLLDIFFEDAHGERRTDSAGASEFLEQQIADYARRLDEAEKRRADFKRTNIGLLPGETGDYYTRLQRAMQSLAQSKAELVLANERRAEYLKQLEGEEPVFGVFNPGGAPGASPTSTGGQIAQFEAERNTLLLRYTEDHPQVVALDALIARLRAEQSAAAPPAGAAPAPAFQAAGPLESNPVYQRMRMGLSETEIEIATLQSRMTAQQADVSELQQLVDTIPDIERQLTALNRDYDVTRQYYDQLLQRREALRITGQVEETGDQLQFRVIDPPAALLAPVGPDRPLLLTGTVMAALATALGLAFLLQQMNPVFVARRELRDATGLPVLGTVSYAETAAAKSASRRRRFVFVAAVAALPAALGLAVLLEAPAHRLVAGIAGVLPL